MKKEKDYQFIVIKPWDILNSTIISPQAVILMYDACCNFGGKQ